MKDEPKTQTKLIEELEKSEAEFRRVEEELRASEDHYRTIFESVPIGIFHYTPEGKIITANSTLAHIFGYESPDELMTIVNTSGIAEALYVNPEKQQLAVDMALGQEGWCTFENRFRRKDGDTIIGKALYWVVRNSDGTTSHLEGIIEDITKRKQAEEALLKSESKYRSLLEHSNDAIYLLFKDKFEMINPKFSEMLGVTPEEVKASEFNFMQLVAPKSRPLIEERERMVQRGKVPPSRYEFVALSKDGKEIEVEASVARILYGDGTAVQGILRDISERKQLEAQLRQAVKMEAIGQFAGGIAHDLNNLLTVISGNANLALMSLPSNEPLIYELSQIDKAVKRATNLISRLLAFARRQTLQLKIVDLNSIIADVDNMLRHMIREDIELATKLYMDLWKVKVDPGQMEEIILNLAVNARDAMSEGGKLTIETANVELDEGYNNLGSEVIPGPYVMLSVKDTGCGMNEEVKSKIFDPFFTTKGEDKGSGLGLSIVFGIVKQSNGHISVDSEPDKGTNLRIYLHKVEGEAENIRPKFAPDEIPMGNESILIVEDEDNVRYMVMRILALSGYKIKEAQSGKDALKICAEMKKPFDLVITDIIMPLMKGTELIKHIREKFWPEIKVLYVSGYSPDITARLEFFDKDTPCLQKPFDPLILAHKVREVLDCQLQIKTEPLL